VALSGDEAGQNWDVISGYLYQLLGMSWRVTYPLFFWHFITLKQITILAYILIMKWMHSACICWTVFYIIIIILVHFSYIIIKWS
jgi:hypothetical protein